MIANEEKTIRWKRIENKVLSMFNEFNGLKVIEIGAGVGTYSALMSRKGAEVSVLDYSKNALDRSSLFFEKLGLKAKMICSNALMIDKDLSGKFDISMSFGLAEHFKGEERKKIIKSHIDLLKDGGIAFVSVPNKINLPYRLWKFVKEKRGTWAVGEEYPFSRRELNKICNSLRIKNFCFIGNNLYSSVNYLYFLNPIWIIRKILNIPSSNNQHKKIKNERGTFLDQYLSYALVLCARR
jgi:SAM-dependent methyltransferase